jgi:crotonobetainyl-CoA:carnitine CoA-transferase CaiB-like acyl-CoA transferase
MWNDTFTSKNVPKMPPLSDIYRVTKTKDGYVTYLVVSDSEWQGMCKALGFESLGSDPKFRSLLDRLANIDELVSFLETEIGKWNTTEICNELEKQEVPFARIRHRPLKAPRADVGSTLGRNSDRARKNT